MKNNPEAIAEVQDIIDASKCEQLGVVLLAKTEILDKLIEDSLSDKTKPKDRLAIYLKLNELVNSLTQSLQIDKENERRAREFQTHGLDGDEFEHRLDDVLEYVRTNPFTPSASNTSGFASSDACLALADLFCGCRARNRLRLPRSVGRKVFRPSAIESRGRRRHHSNRISTLIAPGSAARDRT